MAENCRRGRRSRAELVFTAPGPDRRRVLMVAAYRVENDAFRVDKARPWAASTVLLRLLADQRNYALHPDGMRIAIAHPAEGEGLGSTHLALLVNFFEELRHLAPPKP
jgi:hypothetical protein